MKLLKTYEDRDDAEEAAATLTGPKRLASERDSTQVIYNLFGMPTWGNFHRLGLYNLNELRIILGRRSGWTIQDQQRHAEIIAGLTAVAKNFELSLPNHWL